MTPAEWIAARRAMLAKKTSGPWVGLDDEGLEPTPNADLQVGYDRRLGPYWATGPNAPTVEQAIADASLIVAAVNEQEAVVRLVEAVSSYLYGAQPGRLGEMERALAALVGEQEKSG